MCVCMEKNWRIKISEIDEFIKSKVKKNKVVDFRRGWPEGSLFNSYYTDVYGRALHHSQDYSTLPLILIL